MKDKTVSRSFMLLGIVFCVCLILANLLSTKPITFGVFNMSAGLLVFPLSYVVSDCIVEVWGFHKARFVIWTGFLMNFLFLFFGFLADMIPGASYWDNAEGFHRLFGLAPRVAAGSFLAFLCGSFLNAYVMSRMKVVTDGRRFSLRAILSTVAGETVDSLIFFPVALGGVVPWRNLCLMMACELVLKVMYEVAVLPFTIRAVRYIKRSEGVDVYDKDISYHII